MRLHDETGDVRLNRGARGRRRRSRAAPSRWCVVLCVLIACVLFLPAGAAGAAAMADSVSPPTDLLADRAGSAQRPAASDHGAQWIWPVADPAVSAPYAAPPTRYAAGHRGIDLTATAGARLIAPDGATVRFAGMVVDRPVLTLDHGGGVLSSFEPASSDLPVGSRVARGAVIGVVASGGHCGTACVHVGVRVNGEYVSPMLFFGRVPPAILLPLGGG